MNDETQMRPQPWVWVVGEGYHADRPGLQDRDKWSILELKSCPPCRIS